MVDPTEEPIELVPSRHEAWRERFERERDRIETTLASDGLADAVDGIEHVGSTAVPDLPAKDVVDVDVVVPDDRVSDVSRHLAETLGGTRVENADRWHPVFREERGQRFNDHVFGVGSDRWRISVVTRDVLRQVPALREEYAALKRTLAARHDDIVDYSDAKTAFVERLLERARSDPDVATTVAVPEP